MRGYFYEEAQKFHFSDSYHAPRIKLHTVSKRCPTTVNGGGISNPAITVSTAGDFIKAIETADEGDTIVADNVVIPSSYANIAIEKNIKITGNVTVDDIAATSLSATVLSDPANTGNPLFRIIGGATVDFSGFYVTVSEAAAEAISAIVSVADGGIKAENLTVKTPENTTVTGVYIGAAIKAEDVNITTSVVIVSIDAANNEAPTIAGNIDADNDEATTSLPYDVGNDQTEFYEKLEQYGKVRLTEDVTLDGFTHTAGEAYTFYLNENKLTIQKQSSIQIQKGTSLTFIGGKLDILNPTGSTTSANLVLLDSASVTLDNVMMHADGSAIYPYGNNTYVEVRNNSSIIAKGAFAIGTNASVPTPNNVTINLYDSTFDSDATAICMNIDGTLTMERCQASSNHVVVLVRGGHGTFIDSTLSSRGTYIAEADNPNKPTNMAYYFDGGWRDGTYVAYATLVVGNTMDTAYKYDASATLENTTLEMTINDGVNNEAKTLFIASVGDYDATLTTDDKTQADNIIGGDYFGPNCSVIYNGKTTVLPDNSN